MAGSSPGGNSTSITGPVIWITFPAAMGWSFSFVQPPSASAPEAISIISRVMVAWRVLL
jgi:hypothetical protein